MRSAEALKGKATGGEQQRILKAIEDARKAAADVPLDDLRAGLREMERTAGIIGQAMLRP